MQSDLSTPTKKGTAPAWTLVLLSPVVSELLSGSTRISTLFALIPEIMLWGCGALLIRETARRRSLGWNSLLLMGLALSIAEEFLIQQTSLAPLPWLSGPVYGRALGVNWLYLLFMLGYESVWVVLVPVQLTELIFPKRRTGPWLQRTGLIVTAVIFLLGTRVAWYGWVKRVRPMVFHAPAYNPPPLTLLVGALAIVLLVVASLYLKPRQPRLPPGSLPAPMLLGVIAVAFGLPWYGLIVLTFTSAAKLHALPFWLPMLAGIAWAGMAYLFFRRWSSSTGWSDVHRYALTIGAMLVPMIGGFIGSSSWLRIDLIGKVALDAIAIVLLIALGQAMQKRAGLDRKDAPGA
jgi:hypothetical protein